jgi:hypothetical protein
MTEAAEVATWTALAGLSKDGDVAELAAWALPLHERHLKAALRAVKELTW